MMDKPTIEQCAAWLSAIATCHDSPRIEATIAYLRDHARLRETNAQMLEAITAALGSLRDNDVHSAYQILLTVAEAGG